MLQFHKQADVNDIYIRYIDQIQRPMQSQEKCVKCDKNFTHNNMARILPECGHNICNDCIKILLKTKQTRIKCKGCNQYIHLEGEQLENFPKNISIVKEIRGSSLTDSVASTAQLGKIISQNDDTDINSGSILINDSQKYSSISDKSSMSICQLCPMHGKPLQIICIEDNGLLCPHCAIFGEHRNHQFKTFQQFEQQLKDYQKGLKQINGRKKNADLKIKGENYIKNIVDQISTKKTELVKQVKDNFLKLRQYLKNAEERVFHELVEAFKKIEDQIKLMTTKEDQYENKYQEWKRNAYDYLSKIKHGKQLVDQVSLFYSNNKPKIADGNYSVQDIEDRNTGINDNIRSMIKSIHMEYSVSIEGYIYNYARVVSTATNLTEKTIDLTPRSVSQQKKEERKKSIKMEFVKAGEILNDTPSVPSVNRPIIPKSKSPDIKTIRSNSKLSQQSRNRQIRSPKKGLPSRNSKSPNKNDMKPIY